MKSFSAVSILAVAAVASAQSSSSSAASATSTASSLIPTDISSGCSAYLQNFNSNSTITSCLNNIVDASSAYGPLGNSSGTFSAGDISSTLNTLCSSSGSCPTSTIRNEIASFGSACSADLSNTNVRAIYEALYMFLPFQTAICSKSDSGQYCVATLSSSSSASGASSGSATSSAAASSSSAPAKRAEATTNVTDPIVPNAAAFKSSNLPFLLYSASASSGQLCTTCLRNVLSAYIAHEEAVPYAPGDISQSPMLGGQNDLYNAATSNCGSNFLSGSVQAAGGLGDGIVAASGAVPKASVMGGVFSVAAAGLVALVFL